MNFRQKFQFLFSEADPSVYAYQKDDKWYQSVGGKVSGPYRYVYVDMYDSQKDELTFVYGDQNGNDVVMHQGMIISFDELDKLRELRYGIYMASKGAIFTFRPYNDELEAENNGVTYKLQISYDPECVLVNDQQFGKSAALNAWYNPLSKAFLWFAQEYRELVLYQYHLT